VGSNPTRSAIHKAFLNIEEGRLLSSSILSWEDVGRNRAAVADALKIGIRTGASIGHTRHQISYLVDKLELNTGS
jgi:hypothetical protein